jgi:hypothetical protein
MLTVNGSSGTTTLDCSGGGSSCGNNASLECGTGQCNCSGGTATVNCGPTCGCNDGC